MKAYLDANDVELLEQAATCFRDRLLIRVLFHLGCRVSEALGLTVEDIDLGRATVRIQHLKTRVNLSCPGCRARLGRGQTFCPGCGVRVEEAVARQLERRKMRTLPVDRGTLAMLKDFIDRGGPLARGGKMLLFPINRHRAWQVVSRCAQKAGLPQLVNPETGKVHGVSPHKLRDALAVLAVKADDSGDGLRLLQEHLGHSSFNTTARYRKVAGEEHREWYEKLWNKPVERDANSIGGD